MKKITSIAYSTAAFNIAMLILRVGFSVQMISYGYNKLVKFSEMKSQFMNFMGLGMTTSLALTVFAEFFCSIFLILGLFTRLAAVPLIIVMSVALFQAHHADFWGEGSHAGTLLIGYVVILLLGPGRASVDGLISK